MKRAQREEVEKDTESRRRKNQTEVIPEREADV